MVVTSNNGLWIGWLDLLTAFTINAYLEAIQTYRYYTHFPVDRYTRTRILSFTSRIPVTELKQSRCDWIFWLHTKSSQADF
jgi:hypothetical protein